MSGKAKSAPRQPGKKEPDVLLITSRWKLEVQEKLDDEFKRCMDYDISTLNPVILYLFHHLFYTQASCLHIPGHFCLEVQF